jgi:hypothetical protein
MAEMRSTLLLMMVATAEVRATGAAMAAVMAVVLGTTAMRAMVVVKIDVFDKHHTSSVYRGAKVHTETSKC